jgi:uncharacterized protein with PIN domain
MQESRFDCTLDDVLNRPIAVEFVLSETARCPNCGAALTEKTRVEPEGGIEASELIIRPSKN